MLIDTQLSLSCQGAQDQLDTQLAVFWGKLLTSRPPGSPVQSRYLTLTSEQILSMSRSCVLSPVSCLAALKWYLSNEFVTLLALPPPQSRQGMLPHMAWGMIAIMSLISTILCIEHSQSQSITDTYLSLHLQSNKNLEQSTYNNNLPPTLSARSYLYRYQ